MKSALSDTMSATEAAAALGVSVQTLYAYVSRRLIRSEQEATSRRRRYRREDIVALQRRKQSRANPQEAIEAALHWGAPILESSLSLLKDGQLYYRGINATDLAASCSFEQVCMLLWTGSFDDPQGCWAPIRSAPRQRSQSAASLSPRQRSQSAASLAPRQRSQSADSLSPRQRSQSAASLAPRQRSQSADSLSPRQRSQSAASLAPRQRSQSADSLSPRQLDLMRGSDLWRSLAQRTRDLTPMQAFSAWLALAAAGDDAALDLRPNAVIRTAVRIVRIMTAAAVRTPPHGSSVALALQRHWCPADIAARSLIDAALILCADHELNISAFTARCVASAEAGPYAVTAAGLAALSGMRHGGECERGEALFDEAARPGARHTLLAQKLRRGERIPGFGQRLYPGGDPRARWLLDAVYAHAPRAAAVRLAQVLCQQAQDLMDEKPTIDFALVTLGRALSLPPGAPLALFALGRTAGWLAHALEQYQDPRMIRPRARYIGRPPQ